MTSKSSSSVFEPNSADQLGIWDRGRLFVRLMRDPRVSTWLKAIVPALTAIYLISPIDLIPDFILGVGELDDLGVAGIALILMLRWLPRLAPQRIVDEHLAKMGAVRTSDFVDDRAARDDGARVVDATFRVKNRDNTGASAA